jgi:hypothetical protein
MSGFLRKLCQTGVTEDLPEREARSIEFINVNTLTLVPFGVLNILLIAAYLPATRLILAVAAVHVASIGLTLLWTHLRSYLTARIWIGSVGVVFLTLETALLGTEAASM